MDKFIIKKFRKTYNIDGKSYWLDALKLAEAIANNSNMSICDIDKISTLSISTKLELNSEDEALKGRTASRIKSFLIHDDGQIGLNTIKLLGKAYADDEMAFFEQVQAKTIAQALMEHENKKITNELKEVYLALYEILDEIEDSENYNYIPGTLEDGFKYYEKKLDKIRVLINTRFLDNKKVRDKLLRIVDETEIFIKSYSIPGVVKRWKEINKKITYFDAVYDICYQNFELYNAICNEDITLDNSTLLLFSFVPTLNDFRERAKYFDEIARKNEQGNLQYSEDHIFKIELLKTLELVFEHDFTEFMNK